MNDDTAAITMNTPVLWCARRLREGGYDDSRQPCPCDPEWCRTCNDASYSGSQYLDHHQRVRQVRFDDLKNDMARAWGRL